MAKAKIDHGGSRISLGPIKLYIDDVVEPHTAAMLAPYANAAGSGSTFWPPEAFCDLIIELEARGLQAFVHGTGDRGIRTALDGFQAARRRTGARHPTPDRARRVPRPRGRPALRRARRGRVHAAAALRAGPRARLAGERRRGQGAVRVADAQPGWAGATLAFSSDWNVAEMDPMVGIYTALTRGRPRGSGRVEHRGDR